MNFPLFAWMASIATAQTLRVRGGRSLQSFALASNDPALGEDGISVDLASVYAVPGSRALRKSTKSSKIFLTKSSKTVVPTNAELASEIEELKAVIDALLSRIDELEDREADGAKAGNLFDVTFLHINDHHS